MSEIQKFNKQYTLQYHYLRLRRLFAKQSKERLNLYEDYFKKTIQCHKEYAKLQKYTN